MSDGRRTALSIVNALVLLAGLVALVWRSTEPTQRVVDTPLLTSSASAAESATSTTTTTTPPPPPTLGASSPGTVKPHAPVNPPANPRAAEVIQEIGSIEIPKIGLAHKVMHGISMRNIDHGPSHWPGTALPGEVGNSVFAGHRVTHSRPFRNIDKLALGDEVFFTINGTRTRYLVTETMIVAPTALYIVDPTPTPTATLFACHPPGSARQRYVVRLALATDD